MYKPQFNKRRVLVFRQFGNKGYSLFSCLGREVVCSVLSVATLTYASAESVSTHPVTADSVAVHTDREIMLDEVAVTGSRAPLTKSQAARMVTVLDRSDIQQAPVQSVNDLLKYAVGVDVRQRGPIGAQTDVSIRGGTQEQIIILLNGINICDPQTGHNAFDLPVDLSDIVRIEVLEGPAGRIYGTSSLVGAINIVTRPPSSSPTGGSVCELRLEGGSYGYASAAASIHSPQGGSWRGALSTSYSRSDGYSRSKAGALNTDYSGTKAFCQGGYATESFNMAWHAGLTDKGWGSATFYASPKWQADDQYEHTTKLFADVQAEAHCGGLSLHPAIYWNQHQDRYEGYRNQPDKMKFNYNRTDVFGLQLNTFFDWAAGRTAFGAEIRNENLLSGNLGEVLARKHHINGTDRDYTLGLCRTNISAFAEHNLLLRQLTLSAGMVLVKNTWADMNPTLYPGVDISYRPNSILTLHASYNTSLRMPSFTEMYYRLQGYQADPHLKPEEMSAIEIGATMNVKASKLSIALWHHQGRNMIDWIMDTRLGDEATWQSVNHTRLSSIGLETSARVVLPWSAVKGRQTTVDISYSYIDQEKKLEEGIVSQYALEYLRHKLVARVQLPIVSRLSCSVNVRWQDRVGKYTDFNNNVCDYKPFTLVDARMVWTATRYRLYLEANNLFNHSYVDYGHVPQPGIWLIAGCSLNL
ncbi:MAG: TonB-dependent receptor [Prevotella sp.]|nr:TonB-dependent receptor [Prevotella sp.]